jgi:serine phosphatase RsbU (regulator of sigma subunit)/pSer/pThr/pTyr-binding forkhead associated (FHA) protein
MTPHSAAVSSFDLVIRSQWLKSYTLGVGSLRIGRERGSDICLEDKRVSAAHARIIGRDDGTFLIEDLKSYNGTYLDGHKLQPFEPVPLRDGCRVRVCEFSLVFHLPAAPVQPSGSTEPTILGTLDDMSSLSLSARADRAAVVLRAVLEINRLLAGTTDLNQVLGRAIEELFAVFPQAEYGFILTEEPDGKLYPRATRRREGAGVDTGQITLSQTVLEHVMRNGQGLIISGAENSGALTLTDSFNITGIRTALCVPVLGQTGRPIGFIQLDARLQSASFDEEDLELLAAVSVPVGVVIENHRLLKERAALVAAGEVQAALLPRCRPSAAGYVSWEHYHPALEVGGDYYDYVPVEIRTRDGREDWVRWAVALGDVSGKGMPAALVMAKLSAEVRHLVRAGCPPDRVAASLNRDLFDVDIPGRFVTFLLVMVDAERHTLTAVNAGHMPALIRRADGTTETFVDAEAAMPLGIERDTRFRTAETTLGPGDVAVMFTDGVNEALGRDDTFFGIEGVRRALAGARGGAKDLGEAILRDVRRHSIGRPQSDDIALVCFGRE